MGGELRAPEYDRLDTSPDSVRAVMAEAGLQGPSDHVAFLGRGQRPAGSPSAPRGQPERPAEAHTEGMVRAIAASRGAGSDQRPPRPAPEATSTRGQRPTTSAHRQCTLSATSAGKVICSPFSVEGFPSRASVASAEGEHGETGLSLHRTM